MIVENKIIEESKKRKSNLIKNIVLLLGSRLIALFGTQIYNFAIGLYVLKTTGSATAFSIVLIFGMVPRILFGPIAGIAADRLNRKKLAVSSDFLSALIMITLFAVSSIYGLKLEFIYLSNFLICSLNTFFDITLSASIPNLVDEKSLLKTNSLNQSVSSLAQVIAPVIGGIVFATIDIKIFLIVNTVTFILSSLSQLFIDYKFNIKEQDLNVKEKLGVFSEFKEAYSYLRTQKALFMLFIYAVFINFLFCLGFNVAFPYTINTVLKLSSAQFGTLEGTFSVGVILGSIALSLLPEREKKYKTLMVSMLLMSIGVVLLGIPVIPGIGKFLSIVYFVYYIILMVILGVVMALINVPIMVIMQREIPDELRGRIFGLLQTMCIAISPLGLIIAGVLIGKLPVYVFPMFSGVALMILTIIAAKNKNLSNI